MVNKSQRVYQAQTIYELEVEGDKISYIIYKNTLVLSKEAFLVEDVVRNIQDKFAHNFINSYPMLSDNPSFATDIASARGKDPKRRAAGEALPRGDRCERSTARLFAATRGSDGPPHHRMIP